MSALGVRELLDAELAGTLRFCVCAAVGRHVARFDMLFHRVSAGRKHDDAGRVGDVARICSVVV